MLGFGQTPSSGRLKVAMRLLSKASMAPGLVRRLKMAHHGLHQGASSSVVWRVLCSAKLDVGGVLFNPYILATPEATHVVFMMLRTIYLSAKRVTFPHPPIVVTAVTPVGMLCALEGLGGDVTRFSRAVYQVCRGPEDTPDRYNCAVRAVVVTAGPTLLDTRVLSTPILGDFVLWCMALIVKKTRRSGLDFVQRTRGRLRPAAEPDVEEAARLLQALSEYRPGEQ